MGSEVDWGDEQTDKEMKADDVERYKASDKRKDLIRIVSKPIKYYSHSLPQIPWYCNCAKVEGRCLLCERQMGRGVKIGCVIVHIAEKPANGKGKYTKVGTCKVWLFGKDKWNTLSGIMDDYSKGDKGWLKKQDLIVTCNEEQFQDLDIRPTLTKTQATKDMMSNFAGAVKKLEWYTAPADLNRQKEILGIDVSEGDEDIEVEESVDDVPFDVPGEGDNEIADAEFETVEEKGREPGSDDVEDILDEIDSNGAGSVG